MSLLNRKFVANLTKIIEEKDSLLCVGLDPAIPRQRAKNVISTENRVSFMEKIIEDVAPYTSVIKMNRQYLIGLTVDQILNLNKKIHENNMLSIVDHKLGDIGSSNDSAIYWFKEENFDAFTFSPFAGNIKEATDMAHKQGLGIIVLTLMSNPQAIIQKQALVEKTPLFLHIAEKCKNSRADGIVIGATGHVEEDDINKIRDRVGSEVFALVPGVGAQGGDAKTVLSYFNSKTLVNVGRMLIYSDNPDKKAKEFRDILNSQKPEC